MKNITHKLGFILVILMFIVGCKVKQPSTINTPVEIAQHVPEWKKTYDNAIEGLENCRNLPDSNMCKSTFYYQLAFLFENLNDSTIVAKADSAEQYYKASLNLFPNDRTIRERLVVLYNGQGRYDESQSLLEKLYQEFPNYTSVYALQISKLLYQQKEYAEALQWAITCTDLDPYQESGWKNLIVTLDKSSISFNEIEELSYKALNYGFINQSLQLIEWYINANYKDENLDVALVNWCAILFDSQSDYNSRFRKIPPYEEWPSMGVRQLQHLFEINATENIRIEDLQRQSFWYNHDRLENPNGEIFNYEILLKFLDHSAKTLMNTNQALAVNRYEAGLQMIEDLNIQSYELTGTYFSFVSSLADIFLIYPQLDSDNRKIDRLTNRLFSGKGFAYRENNKEIIKQFHITLGMIYGLRNQWKDGRATNARFQLENAIHNMEKDESMPLVHELLGNGYLHFLNDKKNAMDQYLIAAQEYLNLDAIFNAKKSLDTLNKYLGTLTPEMQQKSGELLNVYEIRLRGKEISSATNNNIKFVDTQVSEIQSLHLDEAFKNLQVFKIYAEVGQQLNNQEQLYCYKKALDIARKLDYVPSFNDLLKIERIAHAMQNQIETSQLSFTLLCKNVASRTYGVPTDNRRKITFKSVNENKIALYIDPGLFEISEAIYYFSQHQPQTIKPGISYFNQKVIIQENELDEGFILDFQKEWDKENSNKNVEIRKSYN